MSLLMLIIVVAVVGIVLLCVISAAVGSKGGSKEIPEDLTDEKIRIIAQHGNKIQAIKFYRQLHGVGLKEAKDVVDRMAR